MTTINYLQLASVIAINLAWYLYASLEGCIEAHYFHKSKLADDFDNKLWLFDIHKWYTFRRSLFAGLLLVILMFVSDSKFYMLEALMQGVALILSFSFFHNGFYYVSRKKIDSEQDNKGFITNDYTFDSSAKINIRLFGVRALFLVISVFIIVINQLVF
jgi:hypothetical protein